MPTYGDSTLFWNQANLLLPLSNPNITQNIKTVFGQNPGGPGFIGGLVSQGANKADSIGDPVEGLALYLKHVGLNQIIGLRITDANGYFSFGNIPLGDYLIMPDRPFVDEGRSPQVTLEAQTSIKDNLRFLLHSDWLELDESVAVGESSLPNLSYHFFPNPFSSYGTLQLDLGVPSNLAVSVYDPLGRSVFHLPTTKYPSGKTKLDFGQELPRGIYFLQIKLGERQEVVRIVKQ